MGIISIKEKRTASNTTHTTGREKSFHTADRFAEILEPASIDFKLYMYSSSSTYMGGFGAFWEQENGTLEALTMESSSFTNGDVVAARIQTNQTSGWASVSIDLGDNTSGRLVLFGYKHSNFRSDIQVDDVVLNCKNASTVSFDPSSSSVRTNNLWKRSTGQYGMNTNSIARTNYPTGWENVTGTSTGGKWNWDNAGTPSADTGSDNAADNNNTTYYVYYEATGGQNNKGSYLRWADFRNLSSGAVI